MKTATIPVYVIIAVFIQYCAVCLKKNYTNMLRIHSFSIFTIKTPWALAALALLGLLIVQTLINVLKLLHTRICISSLYQ